MKKAKWITGKTSYEDRPYAGPDGAKWIWAWEYCRIHTKKKFIISGGIVSAEAYFVCDNEFDLYINGTQVNLTDAKADISSLVSEGGNIIAVRAYQTNEPERFLSALRGGVTVQLVSGEKVQILTDKSWKQLRLCNFGAGTEPENWQTEDIGEDAREERFKYMQEFPYHPAAIRRASVLSKEFNIDKMPEKAVMRGSAYGLWQPYINGKTVQFRLMPGTMEGRKEYQEFSVLDFLHTGKNDVRITIGNGWYNCECFGILSAKKPCFIGEVELVYADGTKELIATDETWLAAPSRIYEDDLQFGERVDARIDETPSENAVLCDIDAALEKQDYPLMGVSEHIAAANVSDEADRKIFDFGYNFSGRAKFRFYNTYPGQKFVIRYYEFINNDGRYNLHTYSDVFYPCESDDNGKARYAVKNIDCYVAKGRTAMPKGLS